MFIFLPLSLFFVINHVGIDSFIFKVDESIKSIKLYDAPLFSAFIGFLLGDFLISPVLQRVLIAKNREQIKKTYTYGAFGVFCFFIAGSLLGIGLSNSPLPEGISDTTGFLLSVIPESLKSLGFIGIFATIISSADTYLNAYAVQVSKDLLNKRSLNISRALTIVMGLGAIFIATFVTNLFDMLLFSYKFWGPVAVIPLLGIRIKKPLTENQLIFSIFSSATSVLFWFWFYFDIEKATGLSDVFAGIITSTIIYLTIFLKNKLIIKTAH